MPITNGTRQPQLSSAAVLSDAASATPSSYPHTVFKPWLTNCQLP